MQKKDSKLVYTTDPAEARRLRETGSMPEAKDLPYGEQTIRVGIDRKRRKGKTVTVASGFRLTPKTLDKVAKQLKQRCAAGGKSTSDEIEIQGEHVEAVVEVLTKIGFKAR